MKAKDYADKYNKVLEEGGDKDKCLEEILLSFYQEIQELMESRQVQKTSALFSIFDELDNKWGVFVNKLRGEAISREGFKMIIQDFFPEAYIAWRGSKNSF